jgi:hypothetical protein
MLGDMMVSATAPLAAGRNVDDVAVAVKLLGYLDALRDM